MGNGLAECSVGESTRYLVLRAYTHGGASARHRRRRRLHPLLPPFRPATFFFFLFLVASFQSVLARLVSHARRWVGWSQHRPIRPLSSSIYLLVFPIHLANERGEPDLSPLNGINKLYYACTSPWNTIPVGVLVRTTRGRLCAFKANSRSPVSPKLHFRVSCSTLRVWLCAKM